MVGDPVRTAGRRAQRRSISALTRVFNALFLPLLLALAVLLFLFVLVLLVVLVAVLIFLAVGEPRIAQSGADGQHAPAVDVLHERHFAKALHDAVIVHQHRGIVAADFGDRFYQAVRQIEFAALPIAWQILRAFFDGAVLVDHAGTGDADEGREFKPFRVGLRDQILQHFYQPFYRALARRLVVGVAPQLGFPHRGLGQVRRLLPARLDHAAADVGAADVDRQDAVMAFENPGRRQVQTTDQAGIVGIEADRYHFDLEAFGLDDDVGTRDRQFAEPAVAKAAPDHDALGLGPSLGLEEAAGDISELLGEFLDRRMHHCGGLDVVADQDGVQHLLADLVRGLVAERILTGLFQRLAPAVQDLAERALAGAVAQKPFVVLEFDIEAVEVDRRQARRTMPADAGGRYGVFGHVALARWRSAGQRRWNPLVSLGGEWRVANSEAS